VFGIYLLVKAYPDKFTTPGPEKSRVQGKSTFEPRKLTHVLAPKALSSASKIILLTVISLLTVLNFLKELHLDGIHSPNCKIH